MIKFLFFYYLLRPIFLYLNRHDDSSTWVIGGHAGKAYEDNSAALHSYITEHTEQKIIWITKNYAVFEHLKKQGVHVLIKDSLSARIAILKARVLVFSHGHADLDKYIGKTVKPSGLIINLNHSMNYLKSGQLYNPLVEKMSKRQVKKIKQKIYHFDFLLSSSRLEQENFRLSMPHLKHRIILGGGAHLDKLRETQINTSTNSKVILYFPTWRDKTIKPKETVSEIIKKIISNQKLIQWLEKSNYTFKICFHINVKELDKFSDINDVFEIINIDSLADSLTNSDLLISDYSGAIIDALYIKKPVLFFPFDLEDYLKCRHLYVEYDKFAFGDVVTSVDDLVNNIVHSKWADNSRYQEIIEEHYKKMFSYSKTSYSERSYQAICNLLSGVPPEDII